jgi:hypothetical protein
MSVENLFTSTIECLERAESSRVGLHRGSNLNPMDFSGPAGGVKPAAHTGVSSIFPEILGNRGLVGGERGI